MPAPEFTPAELDLLLSAGADPNARDRQQVSPPFCRLWQCAARDTNVLR